MSKRSVAAIVVPAWALATACVLALVAGDGRDLVGDATASPVTHSGQRDGVVPSAVIPQGEPCAEGVDVAPESLSTAPEQAHGMPVWLPDEERGGAEITRGVLCHGSSTQPVVVLNEQMWVFYESGYPVEGRGSWLNALSNEWGGEVARINGLQAYINPSEDPAVRHQVLLMVPDTPQIVRIQAPADVSPKRLIQLAGAIPVPGAGS